MKFFPTLAPRSFSDGGITAAHWREGKNRREKKGERCPIHPSIHPLNAPAGLYERMAAWEALSSGAFSLRDCWVIGSVLISSSCHNNITKLFASGRAQVVMDTPIRWKVKRRFKEVRLSVLLAFLMFVTSRVSAGKRRISCSQTVTLWRGPRGCGSSARAHSTVSPRSLDSNDRRRGWGALEWDFSTGAEVPFFQGKH